jgi:geranylgeranyl diphosphate/geranylgeranyl-bacteriochlorophyllide a reductase
VDPRSKRIKFAPSLCNDTQIHSVRKVEPRTRHSIMKFALATLAAVMASASAFAPSGFVGKQLSNVPKASSSSALEMKYKVAVVGGGPAGACAAEIFAQEKGIDTFLFERKMDNAKPCGGAIPLCMVGEFDLPESVVDRKVR